MRRYWALIACAVVAPAIAVIRRRFLLVTVRGSSMAPVYEDGDTLLAVRLPRFHDWHIGEDLVFARTGQQIAARGDPPYLVKRVCAVAGDPVPRQLDGLPADSVPDWAGRGVVPSGWLLLRGMSSATTPSHFYQVPADAIAGKVVRRLRQTAAPRAASGAGPGPPSLV